MPPQLKRSLEYPVNGNPFLLSDRLFLFVGSFQPRFVEFRVADGSAVVGGVDKMYAAVGGLEKKGVGIFHRFAFERFFGEPCRAAVIGERDAKGGAVQGTVVVGEEDRSALEANGADGAVGVGEI